MVLAEFGCVHGVGLQLVVREILLLIFFGKDPKEQRKEAPGFGGMWTPGGIQLEWPLEMTPKKQL